MRGYARRVVAAAFTLWFALYLGVPQAIHPAPRTRPRRGPEPPLRRTTVTEITLNTTPPLHSEQRKGKGQTEQCCCTGLQCGDSAFAVALPLFAPPRLSRSDPLQHRAPSS